MSTLCAVDAGLGAFKFLESGKSSCEVLEAMLAAPRRLGFGDKPHLTIKFEEVETVVGADARSCRMVRSCWSAGKVSQDVRLIMLTALARIAHQHQQNALEFTLASALPVGLWDTHRESFGQLMSGNHQFLVNGFAYNLQVHLDPDFVLPEPYGSYLYLRHRGLANGETVAVVDVGHSTVDFALVDPSGQFKSQYSTHQDLGMRCFYQLVVEHFSAATGQYLDATDIEKLYMANATEYTLMGNTFRLDDVFKQAAIHYGQQIKNAAQAIWKGVSLDRLLLTGGGAQTVLPVFAQAVAQMTDKPYEWVVHEAKQCSGVLSLCPDARIANALGLSLWLGRNHHQSVALQGA
jgi:hypothetical protein